MLKLLKYEIRKTVFTKFVLLVLSLLLEGWFLYGIAKNNINAQGFSLLFLLFLGVCGIVFMGIQSILTLHRDMNTRQGYMLFMTPHSNYKILGSKVLECGFSTLIAGAYFFLLGLLDVRTLLEHDLSIEEILDIVKTVLSMGGFEFELNIGHVLSFVAVMLSSWLLTVTLAYLADVLSSSILNGKRFGLLISFVIFLILDYGVTKLCNLIPSMSTINAHFMAQTFCYLALSAVMYFVTAKLMDNHLSV